MCNRGSWRGFHTRKISGTLCVIEQCTSCGDYRAKGIDDCTFVPTDDQQPGSNGATDGEFWEPQSRVDQESSDDVGW